MHFSLESLLLPELHSIEIEEALVDLGLVDGMKVGFIKC